MDVIEQLNSAAETYDRPASDEAARAVIAEARRSGALFDDRPLRNALTALRNNRWFDLLTLTGDGVMQAGDSRPFVRKLYAQGLIDGGAISAAIPFLERLVADAADNEYERDEARGLLGRAWKQSYVSDPALSPARRKEVIENATNAYYAPYMRNHENSWHGVNAVACLARAERDGVKTSGIFEDWRGLARTLRDAIDALDDRNKAQYWEYASAAEACIALGAWSEALEWLRMYVEHGETSAFAIASTLRQFTEVWQLSPASDDGAGALIVLLQAQLLTKQGGHSVDADATLQSVKSTKLALEAVLGTEKYEPVEWLEQGLLRSRGVARITNANSLACSTGFLIRARDLDESLEGQFLITNHHVIPAAIEAEDAIVTFEGLDGGKRKYRIARQLWTSPTEGGLDATICVLDKPVKDVEAFPICTELPDVAAKPHVYVIGHPLGGKLAVSINDNLLLDHADPRVHYRAPTDVGSSGSPVFDAEWSLLALHHAGGMHVPTLHGTGTYAANEGMYFEAIAREFLAQRKRRKRATARRRG